MGDDPYLDHTKLFPGKEGYPHHDDQPPQERRILNEDWDILVCFDALRWDAMRILMEDRGHDPDVVDKLHTPTTCSTPGWLHSVWHSDFADWSDVTYVMANPVWDFMRIAGTDAADGHNMDVTVGHEEEWAGYDLREHVGEVVAASDDEVVRERTGWRRRKLSVMPPGVVTDIAAQEEPPIVVHYMQPHTPFIGDVKLGLNGTNPAVRDIEETGGTTLLGKADLVDQGVYRAGYMGNVRIAWDDAKHLMGHFPDANIVFTSDHGECLGPDQWDHGGPDDPRNQTVPWVSSEDL